MTSETQSASDPRLHPPKRFTVQTEPIAGKNGSWGSTKVTVLDQGEPVGSYVRNYGSFGKETFCPFQSGGQWFALYSRDYTATRLMSLPDCRDLGGEEPDSCGFCPVELYVPAYRLYGYDMVHDHRMGQKVEPYTERHRKALFPGHSQLSEIVNRPADYVSSHGTGHRLEEWACCPFGFVAGCVWGDDCSWKIQFIDLARAGEGIIERSERFGYLELPNRLSLPEAIDLSGWLPGGGRDWVGITHATSFDLKTGQPE